ncbi:MAG: molybdopterin-dependent oxidoreductase [Actinobacteria bacterium]|nr:molybdopterin-dependent oxidoreductase [Actinomycetota bacterium]
MKFLRILSLSICLLIIISFLSGCFKSQQAGLAAESKETGAQESVNEETQATELKDVEIKEYKGEKLSSIDDFRENSIKGPQYIDIDSYRLEISGLIDNPAFYKYEEALNFPKYTKKVKLNCVEGWSVDILWEGILLKDVFDKAKVQPEANTVIFYAYDGYSTSLPLDYIIKNDIIMAYKMNGVIIPPERGFPFMLVAEQKWGYKWIKWITKIELSDNPDYRGYWEQRGYSNDGSLDKNFFE